MKKITTVCILPILCLLATCEAFAQNSVYEKLPQIPSTDIQEYIATMFIGSGVKQSSYHIVLTERSDIILLARE